jgi:Ca2+-binding RTX toxin-like protein
MLISRATLVSDISGGDGDDGKCHSGSACLCHAIQYGASHLGLCPPPSEIYGELGSDTLDGDSGNDIVLGDIGYIIRRVDSQGNPILISKTDTTNSTNVWKKDIVLEELGNIEGIHRISQKVNTAELLAEDVTSSSLVFVANGFDENGEKSVANKAWLTDLLLFKLNSEPGIDKINGGEGDDVCIGQRGDDHLQGGPGNDLLIGDAGTNLITQNMDMPRIYQIYRTLSAPDGSGYDVNGTDFGAVFSADYELYPLQYRNVDYLSSIIDLVVNVDDLQEKSNLLNDIIGVSALSTTEGYFMQPMFRVTPGFLYETQRLHGNDVLISGPGDSILIGDDIRGVTALDLTTELSSSLLRQELDSLVVDLSVRMSTLEVDTEFFLKVKGADYNSAGFNITVAQDDITTDEVGRHFVSGDSLTIFARSVLGGSLDQESGSDTVKAIIKRLHDVKQVFMQVHLAMYEVHHDLLRRALKDTVSFDLKSQHALFLANDRIDSRGDGDFVFGDSSTIFFQADRPGTPAGFDFQEFTVDNQLSQSLRGIARDRDRELNDYVDNILKPSNKLSNAEMRALPFDDIPFLLTIGSDTILLNKAANLGVGDFGVVGLTSSEQRVVQSEDLARYAASIEELRTRPSAASVNFQLRLPYAANQQISFYYERYGSEVRTEVEAKRRADEFIAESTKSTILGEFFTGFAYGQHGSLSENFLLDTTASAFDPSCIPNGRRLRTVKDDLHSLRGRDGRSLQFSDGGRCISTFDGDRFDIVDGTPVDGQRGQDVFVMDGVPVNAGSQLTVASAVLDELLTNLTQGLFASHALIVQMNDDIFKNPIKSETLTGLKTRYHSTDPSGSSFIPPIVEGGVDDLMPANPAVVLTPAPTDNPFLVDLTSTPVDASPAPADNATPAPVIPAPIPAPVTCLLRQTECTPNDDCCDELTCQTVGKKRRCR